MHRLRAPFSLPTSEGAPFAAATLPSHMLWMTTLAWVEFVRHIERLAQAGRARDREQEARGPRATRVADVAPDIRPRLTVSLN